MTSLSESVIKFSLPPMFMNQKRGPRNPPLHKHLRRHDKVCTKNHGNHVLPIMRRWMKMNKRILLSPVLEVANEKPAFFGEEHDVD